MTTMAKTGKIILDIGILWAIITVPLGVLYVLTAGIPIISGVLLIGFGKIIDELSGETEKQRKKEHQERERRDAERGAEQLMAHSKAGVWCDDWSDE